MKKTGLRGKACVVPVAVVVGLGMAGMGLVSDGIVMADTASVTDTLNITVNETCTFKNTSNVTFAGSALNGSEVENFNNSGVHTFYVFCNNNSGYVVSATPYDLTATNTDDVISYTANYTHTGTDGMWTTMIATSESGVTVTSPVPVGGGVVLSSSTHSSAAMSFTATYNAYVGTETSAGTYTGTIEYILSSLSGTVDNGGGNGSGSGGASQDNGGGDSGDDGGADSSNEVANNNGGSGDSDSGSENAIPDNANSGDSGSASNETQNVASPAFANNYNTYNTYNTTNTYNTSNTTSYSDGVNTSGTMSGNGNGVSSSNSNDDDAKASNSYEKPLGVITSTTSSDEGLGIDPMPIVVLGIALGVAGVAAIALAQSDKEKE